MKPSPATPATNRKVNPRIIVTSQLLEATHWRERCFEEPENYAPDYKLLNPKPLDLPASPPFLFAWGASFPYVMARHSHSTGPNLKRASHQLAEHYLWPVKYNCRNHADGRSHLSVEASRVAA